MKQRHSFFAILILFASCGYENTGEKAPVTVPETPAVRPEVNWVGFYADTLPCADCPGILTQLELRADSTFVLRERYLDRDSIPYGRIGRWSVSGKKLLFGPTAAWMQGPDGLERLGRDGLPSATELPNSIVRVANFGSSAMHLTGGYVYYADSHGFTPCGSAFAIPVAMDGAGTTSAGQELERTYMKQVKHPPDPLFVQVTASIRTGPAMEGDGTEEYLHIERVERVLEMQNCP